LMPENVFTIKGLLKKNNSGQVLKDWAKLYNILNAKRNKTWFC
jgi:hypothetical protein